MATREADHGRGRYYMHTGYVPNPNIEHPTYGSVISHELIDQRPELEIPPFVSVGSDAGGPGFDFFNQRGGLSDYLPKVTFDRDGWRRMVYAHKVRMISVDVFGSFDCPDAGQMKPSRTRSITPIQALGLLNSPFVVRQAAYFATRLREESEDSRSQVTRAFRLAYARNPSPSELLQLTKLADEQGLEQVCRAIFNTSEFSYIQ